jgi:HSP20 family protein
MAKSATTKLQVKTEDTPSERTSTLKARGPLQTLRRGFDQFLDDFELDFWRPSSRSGFDVERARQTPDWGAIPAVDIVQRDTAYEVTADLPGLQKKNIEVTVVDGNLIIKCEKQDQKEEVKSNYYLRERLFGSFERSFRIPEDVDTDKIEASFKKGVLTVILSKNPRAQKPANNNQRQRRLRRPTK